MKITQDPDKAKDVQRDLALVEQLIKAIDEVFLNNPDGWHENEILEVAMIVGDWNLRSPRH